MTLGPLTGPIFFTCSINVEDYVGGLIGQVLLRMAALKRILLLAVLASFGAIATAHPGPAESAKLPDAASPHGGMETKPEALMMPSGHPAFVSANTQLANSGTVLDFLDSDIYTYLQVTSEKGPVWLAAYKTPVSKGMTVRYPDGIVMSKFYSKSLNHTFDVIIFVDTLAVAN